MKKNTQNSLFCIGLKTALKTLLALLFVSGFIVVSLAVVAPRKTMQAYDAMGLTKVSYLVQKRLYYRSSTNENLDDLIQRAIDTNNYADQVKFIKILQAKDDYSDYVQKVDKSIKTILGERYSVYADSYDIYLKRHLVIALYKTGEVEEAKMLAIDSVFESLSIGVDEMYVYVNLVNDDKNLDEITKQAEFTKLYNRYGLMDMLDKDIQLIDAYLVESVKDVDKAVLLDQKVKIAKIQMIIYENVGDADKLATSSENYNKWASEAKQSMEEL